VHKCKGTYTVSVPHSVTAKQKKQNYNYITNTNNDHSNLAKGGTAAAACFHSPGVGLALIT